MHHGLLPALFTRPNNLPIVQQLIEKPPGLRGNIFVLACSVLPNCFQSMSRVDGVLGNVDIARHEHPLPHCNQIPNPSVERVQKTKSKVVATFVTIGWTIYANKHKGREFEHDTSSFRIQSRWIKCHISRLVLFFFTNRARLFRGSCRPLELLKSRISANLLVFWKFSKWS